MIPLKMLRKRNLNRYCVVTSTANHICLFLCSCHFSQFLLVIMSNRDRILRRNIFQISYNKGEMTKIFKTRTFNKNIFAKYYRKNVYDEIFKQKKYLRKTRLKTYFIKKNYNKRFRKKFI
jgi:hypothetical protein